MDDFFYACKASNSSCTKRAFKSWLNTDCLQAQRASEQRVPEQIRGNSARCLTSSSSCARGLEMWQAAVGTPLKISIGLCCFRRGRGWGRGRAGRGGGEEEKKKEEEEETEKTNQTTTTWRVGKKQQINNRHMFTRFSLVRMSNSSIWC